jgi:hypothetical protein
VFRWTPLRVWLADIGVRMVYSRTRHPQTLGKQERFHRTLATEVLTPDRQWDTYQQLQHAFDQWRIIYNHHRPHDSLDSQVPAVRYRPSPRTYPARIDPPTYPNTWITRTVDTTARINLRHHRHKIGKPFIGRTIGIDPQTNIAYYRTDPIRVVNHVPEQV